MEKTETREKGLAADSALSCKLSEPELVRRKAELQKDLQTQLKNIRELELGFELTFKNDPDLAVQITHWMIAEQDCCDFFDFALLMNGGEELKLRITGPWGTKEFIRMNMEQDY